MRIYRFAFITRVFFEAQLAGASPLNVMSRLPAAVDTYLTLSAPALFANEFSTRCCNSDALGAETEALLALFIRTPEHVIRHFLH